jgi:hypothetical protein
MVYFVMAMALFYSDGYEGNAQACQRAAVPGNVAA